MVHCKVAKLCNFFKPYSQQIVNFCNFLQKSKMCIFLHFVAVKQHLRPLNLHLKPYKQQFFLTSVVLTRLHLFAPICYTCHKSRRRNQNPHSYRPERRMHMPASTKLKITYQVDENKTSSKTLSNMNPEATNANLQTTAEKLNSLQSKTVKSVERIDTTVIGN